MSIGVLVLLAAHAYIRVRRDVNRFHDSVRSDHRSVGLAVVAAAELFTSRVGADSITELVEAIDRREPAMTLRWVRVDDDVPDVEAPRVPITIARHEGAIESVTTTDAGGVETMVTHVLVGLPGRPLTAIEIVEPLGRQVEYEHEAILRTATTTAVVLVLCISLILAFGVFFVGRPLEALRGQAAKIGRGERGARTTLRSADEIGDLAQEMNHMAEALDAARERVQSETVARIETLAQLRHADRLRAVGELASSLAHDLGAPMSAVNARAHMIASGEVDSDRARELAARIVTEIDRMSHSIRQLLDHGRRGTPQREDADIGELATSVAELIEPVAHKRGVRVVVRREGGSLVAMVDAGQIRHVMLNLVTNALDAAAPGTEVEVIVEGRSDAVIARIRDQGPGIAPENLARVFEPFFTTKGRGEGTGLGLSVARAIVTEHGGRLVATAGLERGTELVMSLPRET